MLLGMNVDCFRDLERRILPDLDIADEAQNALFRAGGYRRQEEKCGENPPEAMHC
jgi:hypothetical protein